MRLLLCSAAALVVMASVACASTAEEEATADDEVTSIPRTEPAPAAGDPDAQAAAPSPPGPAAAPAADGGTGGGSDGGAAPDGGGTPNALCTATSVNETEANDTAATANTLPNATSSFCGTLASAADVDFVSFVLPPDAKSLGFGAQYSLQGLAIEGTVAGQAFAVGGAPVIKPGQKYVFQIHTNGAAPVSYRFDVTIGK